MKGIVTSTQLSARDSDIEPDMGRVIEYRTICSTCRLRELCLPCCGLTGSEKNIADRLTFHRIRLKRYEAIYRAGERFKSIYAIRNGFFKSTVSLENGLDQVIGVSIPGDVLGLDGIALEQHGSDCIALEDSEVCAIPFSDLQILSREIPSLQHHLHRMMSSEMIRLQGLKLQLGTMSAEERLAIFLLDLSRRFAARGFSRSEFNLRMTRWEIASYLGLKLETVSRTFSRFQVQGLICVQQKFVRIQDSARLKGVLGHS